MFFFGLISSDAALSHAITEQLRQEEGDWQSAQFTSLEEALAAWSESLPPLIFWDADTTPISSELASFFAHRLGQMPPAPLLLILGGAPSTLESFGVTESFTRPLRLGYLLTRLQFYQRVLRQAPDVVLTLGPWRFAPRARALTPSFQEESVKLTEKEAELLEYLCAAENPVPREELLAAIWGYDSQIDTHTLETHIYRLRRKLMAQDPEGADVFVLNSGGYQINPLWRDGA